MCAAAVYDDYELKKQLVDRSNDGLRLRNFLEARAMKCPKDFPGEANGTHLPRTHLWAAQKAVFHAVYTSVGLAGRLLDLGSVADSSFALTWTCWACSSTYLTDVN